MWQFWIDRGGTFTDIVARKPDGSILIEEQGKGRLLLINKNEELEWEYVNKTNDDKIYQLTWSRIINNIEHVKKLKNVIDNKKC